MTPEQQLLHRANAESEAQLDLTKDILPLLSDVHDEANKGDLVHANKRLASLNAVIANKSAQASSDLLSATLQAAATEKAYAARAETLLTAIKDVADRAETDRIESERKINRLNSWMIRLTVAGLAASAIAVCLAVWGLSLQCQSLEIERKALEIQEKEQNEALAREASRATEQKNPPASPADQSGTGKAATVSDSKPPGSPEATSLPTLGSQAGQPQPPSSQLQPEAKPATAPAVPDGKP